MKLKKLELLGFKSFVDSTVVTFENDITAVVGPNGCGKSNIIDAIRWVMGEQSPKHLRGKSMEDVIFAGSDNRASLSMASVELTFTTDGYQTPPMYAGNSEISICRRVYRDGESEYFINKAPVRLRDIHDLFLGTGVGTKAYSIIEQGRVSQFLTAKPEERRYYIEEAAGVSKFKARKEMALRKMEATRGNVLRLTDLLTELERQINSLDRQAKKAEKYREIKTEYQKWDLAFSSFAFKKSSTRQIELEEALRTTSEKELTLKNVLAEKETVLEAERLALTEKERELSAAQNQLFEFTNTIQLTEANLRFKKEEIERTLREIAEREQEHAALIAQVEDLDGRQTVANERMIESDLERQNLIQETSLLETTVVEAQAFEAELRAKIERLTGEIHSAQARLLQIATLAEGHLRREDEIKGSVAAWEEELNKGSTIHRETEKLYNGARESLDSLRQLKLDLSQKTDELAAELKNIREQLKQEEIELTDLRERLTHRKSRLLSLEQLQRNFEGYQEGTRSVLLRKQEQGDDRVFGTVADFIETNPQYEGAVSAVLGEKLQYVVVKSQEAGMEAVEYLRTASSGRSSFIPMEIRSYGETGGDMPQREGVLGPLSSFVTLRDEYRHLGDFLFGDVVLVEDLKKAIDIWGANGHKKTLVTLNGEVVDPTGVITGGNTSSNSQVLLSMKREIKDLNQLISELEIELRDKEFTRVSLSSRADDMEASVESLKQSSHAEEIRIANQGKDVDQIRKELDALAKRQEGLTAQIRQGTESLAQLSQALGDLQREEEGLNDSLALNREDEIRTKEELVSHIASFDVKSGQLTTLKMDKAQAEEKTRHLEEELTRLRDELMRVRGLVAQCEAKKEGLASQQEMFIKDVEHLEKILEKKITEREELQTAHTAQREEYESRLNQTREEDLALRESRRFLEEATRELNAVTVELSEVRSRIKFLVEQCLERHQLSLADVVEAHFNPDLDLAEAELKAGELREKLSRIGDVNTGALAEYEELKTRFDFLKQQRDDLDASLIALEKVIQKINSTTKERFLTTFNLVNERFQELFPKLFRGGKASLVLTDATNLQETGVDIIAQPPGKKNQSIMLLSGGEKALTAVSLIFSIFQIKPSPFCILDEVDAPLDEANVGRFNELLREMTPKTQFVVITHNKKTMGLCDSLYGVTMSEPGVSRVVSVDMKQ